MLRAVGSQELDLAFRPRHAATAEGHLAAVEGRADHDRAAFGEPVALADRDAEGLLHRAHELFLDRRGTELEPLQGREIEGLDQVLLLQQQCENGRNRPRRRAAIIG
jgi:hypothetical protein